MSWSTSELRVRLAPLNRFKPSSKIFYWPFKGGTSFVDLLCFCSVLCLLCLCARLFMCALWSPAGKGLTSWPSFVVSICEFVTIPLLSWVRYGTWLYRFLIFAPLLTLFKTCTLCHGHFPIPRHSIRQCVMFMLYIGTMATILYLSWYVDKPLKGDQSTTQHFSSLSGSLR